MTQSATQAPAHPTGRSTRLAAATLAVVAITLLALARGLPPHTFYAGDPGVKLIAARHARAQPVRPLEILLPEIGGEPVPFVDPFFIVHGTHSHAVTPEIFPLLTAPLVAAFGLRGAYLLPAAGLLLALAATAWLGVLLDRRRSPMAVVLTTFLGTPLLFYGLEFWEHAPAAGVGMLAAALFVRSTESASLRGTFGAGCLFGGAALLRPEALLFAGAILVAAPFLRTRPSRRQLAATAAGVVAAFLPLELYTLVHFGHPVPPHIAGNPGLLQGDWGATRRLVFRSWFSAPTASSFWRVAPAVLLALAWRPMSYFGAAARRGRAFLLVSAALTGLWVALTAPDDGGAQWGPRYLLLVYPPLAILITDTVTYVVRFLGAPKRPARETAAGARVQGPRVFNAVVVGAVMVLAVGSMWLQRSAYKELRGAKLTYVRMVDFLADHTTPGGAVVTDLWWVDQVAASLTSSRRFYVVSSPEQASEALARLSDAGEPGVTLVRSPVDSAGPLSAWLKDSCYTFVDERGDGEGLIAIQVARKCPRSTR